jgi:hypothetical protein
MITLTYETIEGRNLFNGTKIRGIVTDVSSKNFPIVLWVGETYVSDVSATNRMKRMARAALKEAQNEAA